MSKKDPVTTQRGTRVAGFRVNCATDKSTLRVEVWGYLDADIASAFAREAVTACRRVSSPVSFRMNATGLKPQGRDGQTSLRNLMTCLGQFALSSARISTSNVLTKMQLVRLAKECQVDSVLAIDDDQSDRWPITNQP